VDAGVDRKKGDRLVEGIQRLGAFRRNPDLAKRLKSTIGGYASVFEITPKHWIAATTDGVGTKLKLAFESGLHETIGQDLVAMSVNDLICVGARPLFFLDYFATSGLELSVASRVIAGIARACADSGCLLVGGETAEMPGMYSQGEYDLAGFCVGSLSSSELLPRRRLQPGDRLIGIASSGFHSNGYSLLRRLLDESTSFSVRGVPFSRTRRALVRELLTPTALYPLGVLPLLGEVSAVAHITGSGFLNLPRMGEHVSYEITLPPLSQRARVFTWLHRLERVSFSECAQTFNLGIGLVLAVEAKKAKRVLSRLGQQHLRAWDLGQVVRRAPKQGSQVLVRASELEGASEALLEY
jgi:phosphoribosylaminoimidazole synthetase